MDKKTKKTNNKKGDINDILESIPSYCDKCGAYHDKKTLEVIEKNENLTVIYMICENCLSKNIMYVLNPLNNVINKFRLNVDLGDDEIKSFAKKEPISTDDVLSIYKITKKEDLKDAKSFIGLLNNV